MRFDLYPYEIPSQLIELEGKVGFELSFEDEICQFRFGCNRGGWFTYFRFARAPGEHFMPAHSNHFVQRKERFQAEFRPFYSIKKSYSFPETVLIEECQRALELDAWGRYFCLDKNFDLIQHKQEIPRSRWGVFLLANGQGALKNLSAIKQSPSHVRTQNSLAPFRWHNSSAPTELRSRNTAIWIEWLKDELSQPKSTVRFAHDFSELSRSDAESVCTRWQNGNRDEWEHVSRWILQSEHLLWDQNPELTSVEWRCLLTTESEAEKEEIGWLMPWGRGIRLIHHQTAFQRLQIASSYFTPSRDADLIERHLCVDKYSDSLHSVPVVVKAPSAHERLEAALNLRDWARDKFPANEIEILCGN